MDIFCLFSHRVHDNLCSCLTKESPHSVWPDLAIFLDFGQLFKPWATITFPKSCTFLGNFCKGAKIHFLENFYRDLAIFIWSHCPHYGALPTSYIIAAQNGQNFGGLTKTQNRVASAWFMELEWTGRAMESVWSHRKREKEIKWPVCFYSERLFSLFEKEFL